MTDQVFNVRVEDNFDESAQRAHNTQQAYNDLVGAMQRVAGQSLPSQGAGAGPIAPTGGVDQAGASIQQLSGQASLLNGILQETNGNTRDAWKAMESLGFGADQVGTAFKELGLELPQKNLGELRSELSLAKREFDGTPASITRVTSAEEALAGMQGKMDTALQKTDSTMKAGNRTIGESGVAYGSLGNLIERQVTRIAIGLAVWTTLRTVQQEIQKTIKAMEEYSIAVARFAAVTDASIGDAVNQYRTLRMEAAQAGYTPTQAAPGIQEAARFQKTTGGQQELFGAAAKLSEALGLQDTTQAVNALGEAQRATGKSAQEMADLVYAGYKRVGGDTQQFMNILPSVNALADEMGLSFEKAFALITAGAGASGQSMSTVYQAVNRFSENIGTLDGAKLLSFVNGFKEMGITVTEANGSLKNTGDIFAAIGAQWEQLSSEQQAKVIDLLGGAKVKGTARNAGMGVMQAFAQGMVDSLGDVKGSVDKATAIIDSSFGQLVKRTDAMIAGMEAAGNGPGALGARISQGIGTTAGALFGGITGGPGGAGQGARLMAQRSNWDVMAQSQGRTEASQQIKDQFIKSLSGMTPQEARAAIDQFNSEMMGYWNRNQNIFTMPSGAEVSQSVIGPDEQQKIISTMKDTGQSSAKAFGDAFKSVGTIIIGAIQTAMADAKKLPVTTFAMPQTPQSDFQTLAQGYLDSLKDPMKKGAFSSIQSILPTSPVDLTKSSQAEITQAKQLSLQISNMELNAIREQAIAMGLTVTQADALVAARKQELEGTVKLLETQRDMHYESGLEVANLEKALQVMKEQQAAQKSDFQFRRLKDVSPEQFPQLQALANMYNQFLTNIGSPEKNQNINLLMGEGNVFKTMNVRMTALQLALEDLTKVQKAQLSGTWNLPAGATALVPIQSLDLQRWNAQGSGGISADAIKNLMSAFNTGQQPVVTATTTSGQMTTAATNLAREQIVAAIMRTKGDPYDKIEKARQERSSPEDIYKKIEDIRLNRNPVDTSYESVEYNRTARSISQEMETWSQQHGGRPAVTKQPIDVSVGALPLNASLSANLTITLNSQVIAQSIFPFLYRMLMKYGTSTAQAGGSVGSIRS